MTEPARIRPLPPLLAAVLELTLNRWLQAADEPTVGRLAGHSIALELDPPGLGLVLLGAADRLQVLGELEGETPDVLLRGSPVGLAAALAGGDRSGVLVQGDAAVLTDLQRALGTVSFDWAEWLESVTGAGTAGPLLEADAALRGQLRRFLARGLEDAVDYAQEEARWLPAAGEFEAWAEDLAAFRDDLARLEARVQRISSGRRPPSAATQVPATPAPTTPASGSPAAGTPTPPHPAAPE